MPSVRGSRARSVDMILTVMKRIKQKLQHSCNGLHVYCRLRGAGLSERTARLLSSWWEHAVGWLIYA